MKIQLERMGKRQRFKLKRWMKGLLFYVAFLFFVVIFKMTFSFFL